MNSYNTGYKTQVVLQFKNSSKTSIVKRLVIQILILQENINTCSSKEFNMVFTSSLKFGNFRLDIIIKEKNFYLTFTSKLFTLQFQTKFNI